MCVTPKGEQSVRRQNIPGSVLPISWRTNFPSLNLGVSFPKSCLTNQIWFSIVSGFSISFVYNHCYVVMTSCLKTTVIFSDKYLPFIPILRMCY